MSDWRIKLDEIVVSGIDVKVDETAQCGMTAGVSAFRFCEEDMQKKVEWLHSELSVVLSRLDWFLEERTVDSDGLPISHLEMLVKISAIICDSKKRIESSLEVLNFLERLSISVYDAEHAIEQKNFLDSL